MWTLFREQKAKTEAEYSPFMLPNIGSAQSKSLKLSFYGHFCTWTTLGSSLSNLYIAAHFSPFFFLMQFQPPNVSRKIKHPYVLCSLKWEPQTDPPNSWTFRPEGDDCQVVTPDGFRQRCEDFFFFACRWDSTRFWLLGQVLFFDSLLLGQKWQIFVVTTMGCMNSTLGWIVTTAAMVRILGTCNFLISLLMTVWLGTIICIIPFIHGHPFISMICTNNLITYSLC